MPTKADKLTKDILANAKDSGEIRIDKSLRGQALRRASKTHTPKTMTPWEWQDWYEYYQDAEETNPPTETNKTAKKTPFWKFWKTDADKIKPNCVRHSGEDEEF